MCKLLKIPRSSFYYSKKPKTVDTKLENTLIYEFKASFESYGTRKLKVVLDRQGYKVSRRKIGRIMAKYGLVSKYTKRLRKWRKNVVNNDEIPNVVAREFSNRKRYDVVVSDLTYFKIAGKWHYLCLLLDLCGRKIIGSAIGEQHNAKLVEKAFYSAEIDLRQIKIFHTDRGSEFKNKAIEDILKAFGIERSLSAKGTPYDNAVAESMYHIIKTEFSFGEKFADIEEFKMKWLMYSNWYNNVRIHGSLEYSTPALWHKNA